MRNTHPSSEDIDQLLLNAHLRDQLEPFLDESMDLLNVRQLPTSAENEFLASMLAWERAPTLPIAEWFSPRLSLPHPDLVDEAALHKSLWDAIHQLYRRHIMLDFTDHLSDRELYTVIFRDILPSPEKMIDRPKTFLHWHCLDDSDPELWLKYYATDEERDIWIAETGQQPPAAITPPFPRKMPRRP